MGAAPQPLRIAEDRGFTVPADATVMTAHVDVFTCRLANRSRMAVGDFERAYHRRLQTGDASPFPCPNGYWDGPTFVIQDGRHEWMATVALGHKTILVAWVKDA